MALVFIEGFESWPTTLSADIMNRHVTLTDTFRTDWSVSATDGRRGGACLVNDSSVYKIEFVVGLTSNAEYGIVGYALYAVEPATTLVFDFISLDDVQIRISITDTGAISIKRLGTLLAESAAGVVSIFRWHYIEAKVKVHDTLGYVEVRVDGVTVVTFSGDTAYDAGYIYVDTIKMYVPNRDLAGVYARIDDLYVCDSNGSYNNDFLGDCRVDYLPANADGTINEFSRSAGSTNYENVDDLAGADDDTTYNHTDTAGDQDLYGCANLSFTPIAILGVQVKNMARKTGAGETRQIKALARSGGTTYDYTAKALNESWACKTQILDRDPNGSIAWTESAVNSLEVGLEVA